jgi:CMP-N-acetylneuraminic acid synthetase
VKTGKIVSIIPSRMGSNRVPMKGMRLLGNKTLIEHTADAIKGSKMLSAEIYINSDALAWGELTEQMGLKFYHRKAELATSKSMIDDYLYDFMTNVEVDYLAVITPTAPFITSENLDAAWDQYARGSANTLISAEPIQTHCFYKGKSLNFSTKGQLPRSQDLLPIHALNFSIAIYDCRFFKHQYEKKGSAVLSGEIDTFLLEGFSAIDIDEEKDFVYAELAFKYKEASSSYQARYSKLVEKFLKEGKETRN